MGQLVVIAEALTPIDPWEVIYGAAVRYDFNFNDDGGGFDDFGRFELKLDMRRVVGTSASGHQLKPGFYGMSFFYFDDLRFESDGGAVTVDREFEVGLSLGAEPKYELFGIGLPRIFIGYRFSEEIRGLRITFGELFTG